MKKIKTTVLLFTTAIIWGFAFVAQRLGADYVGAYTFNGTRFMLGAVSLIPVILIFEPKEKEKALHKTKMKKTVLTAIAAGFILFMASTLQQVGIEITKSAGKAGFITGLYTVLVPVFGIFLKRKTGVNVWIGAVLAVAGIYLLSVNEDFSIGSGDIVLLIGAVFWAFHILIIDYFSDCYYSLRFAAIQFFFCSLFSLIGAVMFESFDFVAIKNALIPILYGGFMSVGVAYTCQILAQKDADPTYASIVFSTESVFSAVGEAIILHEFMSGRGYFGCALVFAGIVISQLKFSRNN